jgi:integrative and conjugative element protein (TIGR02256 family)
VPTPPLVWLSDGLLDHLQAEAARRYPLETGGVLLGYRAENQWVVREVLGPGPRARHHRRYFEPDAAWHAEMIRAHFAQTEGREVYIGDWHTHPDGKLQLSGRDLRALRRIIRSPGAIAEPISALMAGGPQEWALSIWAAAIRPREWFWPDVATTIMHLRRS